MLSPVEDGLRHRPRAVWSITFMNCELHDAEVWLKSALQIDNKKEVNGFPSPLIFDHCQTNVSRFQATLNLHPPVEKCYFLSVAKVSYNRDASMRSSLPSYSSTRSATKTDTPTHSLVVLMLKGAWTPSNRDIIFALYDSFRKTQQLKKNLSTASLKGFRCPESSSTPIKTRSRSIESQVAAGSPIQVQ